KIEITFELGKDIAIQEATKKLDILNENTKKSLEDIKNTYDTNRGKIINDKQFASSEKGIKALLDLEKSYLERKSLYNQQEVDEAIRIVEERENKIVSLSQDKSKKVIAISEAEVQKIRELQIDLISDEKEKQYQK